jgi:hypothetical protein
VSREGAEPVVERARSLPRTNAHQRAAHEIAGGVIAHGNLARFAR